MFMFLTTCLYVLGPHLLFTAGRKGISQINSVNIDLVGILEPFSQLQGLSPNHRIDMNVENVESTGIIQIHAHAGQGSIGISFPFRTNAQTYAHKHRQTQTRRRNNSDSKDTLVQSWKWHPLKNLYIRYWKCASATLL